MLRKRVAILLMISLLVVSMAGCKTKDDTEVSQPGVEDLVDTDDKNKDDHADSDDGTDVPDETDDTGEDAILTDGQSDENQPEIALPTITKKVVYTEDFESGQSTFKSRGEEHSEIVEDGYLSNKCFASTNRTETWQGPLLDVTEYMLGGEQYEITAMVKYTGVPDKKSMNLMIDHDDGSNYIGCGSIIAKNGEWTELKGSVIMPTFTNQAGLYIETDYKAVATEEDLIDIYIDEIMITKVEVIEADIEGQSLYEVHSDYFSIGVGITAFEVASRERVKIITKHFNSMTMGNEMKPDYILDYTICSSDPEKYNLEPAIRYENLDIGLEFAKEHGIGLRGHTLVWHSQTPDWFFKENYSKDEDAPFVSKEVMLARMESYIKQVISYCQGNYPGVVYAWDVVNEAIEPGHGKEGGYRSDDSLWYQVIGPEFVEMAFTYARKYADPDVKLFYNDYNCHMTARTNAIYDMAEQLKAKGVIDGIGLQSHYGLTTPTVMDVQKTLTKFGELGLELQITELDINTESNTEEDLLKLAIRYKKLMNVYRYVNDNDLANITNVTVWGLCDKDSWLNDERRKYPLLFDDYLQPKQAFWGFYLHDDIPNY